MTHAVSPSQIETYRDCPRKWYYGSVLKLPRAESAAAELGTLIHYLLEHLARGENMHDALARMPGAVSGEGAMLAAQEAWDAFLMHTRERYPLAYKRATDGALVRKKDDSVALELDWNLDNLLPLPVRGRIDMETPWFQLDWKSTSNFRYIKSDKALASDTQVLLYGKAFETRHGRTVPFLHVYTMTGGTSRALTIETDLPKDVVDTGISRLRTEVQEMARTIDGGIHAAVKNPVACRKYGGCPYFRECYQSQNTEVEMTLDPFAARRAATATQINQHNRELAPAPAPAPVPAPAPAPVPAPVPAPLFPPVFPPVPSAAIEGVVAPKAPRKSAAKKAHDPTPGPGPAPGPAPGPGPERASDAPGDGGTVLFIGCAPLLGLSAVYFDDWIAPFAARAAASLKVPHWSMADYGKGKAVLVALVVEELSAKRHPELLVVDRRNPAADAVCEVLIPAYDAVVSKLG